MGSRRALHFVFKVGNRKATIDFYRKILGMKILRHEEFEEGCKAACNGPYDGKWSKSMVGYGAEDSHFVVELTYNYGIKQYELGNDFQGLTICSSEIFSRIKSQDYPFSEDGQKKLVLSAPDGYKFFVYDEPKQKPDPVGRVALSVSNLEQSVDYWHSLLAMDLVSRSESSAILQYSPDQCQLELIQTEQDVNHAAAFGRIAFSCPRAELSGIQEKIKSAGKTILTPLVSLDTPGKATVEVVILADPDGHEICFVGDEAFRQLSIVDPNGAKALDEAMAADKSDEWFEKQRQRKQAKK